MAAYFLVLPFLLLSILRCTVALSCTAKDIPTPELFGVQVLHVSVEEHRSYVLEGESHTLPPLLVEQKPLDFCNVTITYTHPGLNDTLHVYVWMPLEGWNGNFLGQGGGGFAAGTLESLSEPVILNYASAITDAGHNIFGDLEEAALNTTTWSLVSPGNVNLVLLQNFAYRALDEMTHFSKAVIQSFYGTPAKYSYWHGCSTGGRQGFVQAQRYPTNYDGIMAACPAINWVTFGIAEYWANVIMYKLKYYPPACELNAITAAAIDACDELDGVKDGIVSAPGLCQFDAQSMVGQNYDCQGETRQITAEAAQIAAASWQGPMRNGKPVWFGVTHEASLTGHPPGFAGHARTACDEHNRNCRVDPFRIPVDWIQRFVFKDPGYDPASLTEEGFFDVLRRNRQEYGSLMDTADPDLNAFKAAGGKIIHWHGLADRLIFPNGSSNYYERVQQAVEDVPSFYRYFEAPGVDHCFWGPGAFPTGALSALVDWVERGIAPDKLDAATFPSDSHEKVKTRPLCPYPLVAAYKAGDPDVASSFACAESFDAFSQTAHDEL